MPESHQPFKVKANEFVFSFDQPAIDKADFVKKSPTEFNLIIDHRSVNSRLLEEDATGKKIRLELGEEIFEIEIEDDLDQMLEKMGFGTASNKLIKEVRAPMPGMVLETTVSEGQQVNEGDKLLILVAMKMENSILVHSDAIIKKINVTAGQAVEKGQILVELE